MTVTRPARLTGAALCGALALVIAVWLLRDLAAFGSPGRLAWYWAGEEAFPLRRRAATSLVDPLLLVAYAATAVASLRSPLAAPALAATGAVTLALRLPGLWATAADALATALLTLALAAGLVVTAAAGRRPAETRQELPGRPRTGPAVAAGALCAVAGIAWAAWEAHRATALPVEATVDRFTGGRSLLLPALAVPPAWLNLTLSALFLTAAAMAFVRSSHAQPLGLLAGLFLTGCGFWAVAPISRAGGAERFAALDDEGRLTLATSGYGLLAGVAVLVLLSLRGAPRSPHGGPVAALPPAPPHPRPPGW